MELYGLIAFKENTCYIVPTMLPYANEKELLDALQKTSRIQTSKTICLKLSCLTRPVFHFVLAKCIKKYTSADPSYLEGLDSQRVSERKTCSKNFAYFTTEYPQNWPWHFVLAYQLGFIRVTLFRRRKKAGDPDYSYDKTGVKLLEFVKKSLKTAIGRYQHNDEPIMFIDTDIFHGKSKPIQINDYLFKNMKETDGSGYDFTMNDVFVWVSYIKHFYLLRLMTPQNRL